LPVVKRELKREIETGAYCLLEYSLTEEKEKREEQVSRFSSPQTARKISWGRNA
jgi:hypothetical protein